MKLDAWKAALDGYAPEKREFILNVIENGYKLVEATTLWSLEPVHVPNYSSVLDFRYDWVNKSFIAERDAGLIEKWPRKPRIVTARGAVPKPHVVDDWRIITDLSAPKGKSVNDLVKPPRFSLATFDRAAKWIRKYKWIAKVDLKAAYRHIPIDPDNWELYGFEWNGEFFVDKYLCFGLNTAPWVFTQFTEAIVWIANERGIKLIIGYLDDFLIVADTKEQCEYEYNLFLALLEELGFVSSPKKCIPPCQCLDFLGITIDTTVPEARLSVEHRNRISAHLVDFLERQCATARELQSLAGLLNCASKVVFGGRTFLRRLLDAIKARDNWDSVISVTEDAKMDLRWWQQFMSVWDGKALLLDPIPMSAIQFQTDACLSVGCGAFFDGLFFQEKWCDSWVVDNINTYEVYPVLLAARTWGHLWRGRHVVVWTDNDPAVFVINSGTSRTPRVMEWLRELFFISAECDFRLTARHVPGKFNMLADALSRFDQPRFLSALARWKLAKAGFCDEACEGAPWLRELLSRHEGKFSLI